MDDQNTTKLFAESYGVVEQQLRAIESPQLRGFLSNMALMRDGKVGNTDFNPALERFEQGPMAQVNAVAKALRNNTRSLLYKQMPDPSDVMGEGAYQESLAKSVLDVGYLTDLAQLTGGQSMGLVSIDTRVMRGTVRPNSFTLYNVLKKTRANQMVDFWTTAFSVGGQLPGSAYASTASQTSGSITPNNGTYANSYCTLRMLVDGRALSVALAAQSSFIDIAEQESANAAINLLATMNWAVYWGNSTLYSTQPNGINSLIPAQNVTDFQYYYNNTPGANSLSVQQALYNLIYDIAGFINGQQYGLTTHAFMTPSVGADIQTLVTGRLDNWLNTANSGSVPIVLNGDFQGTRTRFGDIQFPMDLFIDFRDRPAQSIVNQLTGTPITVTTIGTPASLTPTVNTAVAGSNFTNAYAGTYTYAVAATDSAMNETVLTYSTTVTGVASGDSVSLAIVPTGTAAVAFRVYRSGLGYATTGVANPSAFRFIGDIAANGNATVTFTDTNAKIPGGETLFLLDLDDSHDAIDYRWLLPITKVDLFAQNLYMPWAVTHIGTPRLKMPKWHATIKNYIPANPNWNPLAANTNAQPRYAT
jgi:hypothetical protein